MRLDVNNGVTLDLAARPSFNGGACCSSCGNCESCHVDEFDFVNNEWIEVRSLVSVADGICLNYAEKA